MPDSVAAGLRLAPEELTRPFAPEQFAFDTTDDLEPFRGVLGQERAVEALQFRCGDAASGLQRIRHGRAGDRTLLLRQTLSASRGQARRHALRLGPPEQFRRAARTSGDRAAAGQRDRIQRRHRPSDRQPDVDLPGGLRASGLPAEEERRRPRFQPALRPRPGLGGAARPGEGRGAVPRQRQRRLHPDEGRQGPRRGRIRPVARSRARAFPQRYRRPRGVPQRGTGEPAAVEARVEQPVARAQRGNHHPGPAACWRLWWRSTTTTRASAPTCRRCN